MNKQISHFITIAAAAAAASCSGAYNIEGNSSVSNLDGEKLYLNVIDEDKPVKIDSCDMVHGKFHFAGPMDSVKMASIVMDNYGIVMPLVMESSDKILVSIDNARLRVSGSPLNEKLYKFLDEKSQFEIERLELTHKHDQAIMNGEDMDLVNRQLNLEAAAIAEKEDKFQTTFITDNFDNVLSVGAFMIITSEYPFPHINPWIEDIMSKANDKFKNDPYVKSYYQKALENERRMGGQSVPPPVTEAASAPKTPAPKAPADTAKK